MHALQGRCPLSTSGSRRPLGGGPQAQVGSRGAAARTGVLRRSGAARRSRLGSSGEVEMRPRAQQGREGGVTDVVSVSFQSSLQQQSGAQCSASGRRWGSCRGLWSVAGPPRASCSGWPSGSPPPALTLSWSPPPHPCQVPPCLLTPSPSSGSGLSLPGSAVPSAPCGSAGTHWGPGPLSPWQALVD